MLIRCADARDIATMRAPRKVDLQLMDSNDDAVTITWIRVRFDALAQSGL